MDTRPVTLLARLRSPGGDDAWPELVALAAIVVQTLEQRRELIKILEPCDVLFCNFRAAHRRHSGIESVIGALQSGNGLKRCRDHSEGGFERYISLGILGRNLRVLGTVLFAREDAQCQTAYSKRSKRAV